MALNYEFDLFSTIPEDVVRTLTQDNNSAGVILKAAGINPGALDNQVACFRSEATVRAFMAADPTIKWLLQKAGFGFQTYHSGAPDGHFPLKDAANRKATIRKLVEHLDQIDITAASNEPFDFMAFLEMLETVKPLAEDTPDEVSYQPASGGLTEMTTDDLQRGYKEFKRARKKPSLTATAVNAIFRRKSRADRAKSNIREVKNLEVRHRNESGVFLVLPLVHESIFRSYEREITKWLKAYQRKNPDFPIFHTNMRSNIYLIATKSELPPPYDFYDFVIDKIEENLSSKEINDEMRARVFLDLFRFIDKFLKYRKALWPHKPIYMAIPHP